MSKPKKPKITVFEVEKIPSGEANCGASLPRDKPGELQLVFRKGHEQLVVIMPAYDRFDFGMKLLGLDGSSVKVSIGPKPTFCFVCNKPTRRSARAKPGDHAHAGCEPRPAR